MAFKTDQWFAPEEIDSLDDDERQSKDEWRTSKRAECAEQREKLKFRLWDEGEVNFGNKLANCGIPSPLVCNNCGNRRVVETQCRQRWCPSCSWSIQQKRVRRFGGAVAMMQWPAMLTLTQKNSDDPESVRWLRKNWSKMRRRKLIADKVAGGVAGIEVTNIGNGWHPHLHAIIDCRWLAIHTPEPKPWDSDEVRKEKTEHAQGELAWLWGSVCGQQNSHVYIRRCHGLRELIYSLKYSVAAVDLLGCPDAIGPLLHVMQKSRLVSAFGSLHGRTKEMDADEKPVMVCSCCGAEKSQLPESVCIGPAMRSASETRNTVSFSHNFRAK